MRVVGIARRFFSGRLVTSCSLASDPSLYVVSSSHRARRACVLLPYPFCFCVPSPAEAFASSSGCYGVGLVRASEHGHRQCSIPCHPVSGRYPVRAVCSFGLCAESFELFLGSLRKLAGQLGDPPRCEKKSPSYVEPGEVLLACVRFPCRVGSRARVHGSRLNVSCNYCNNAVRAGRLLTS